MANTKITSLIATFRKALIEPLFSTNSQPAQTIACAGSAIASHGRALHGASSRYTASMIHGKRTSPHIVQFFEWTPYGKMQLSERHRISALSESASWRAF